MSTDTEITRSLHEAAEDAAVPPVDLDALRAGGRRHARRRSAARMAAAALVLAVVGGGVVLGPDAVRSDAPPVQRDDSPPPKLPEPPRTMADLPVGDAPALPYFVGDVLHTGGLEVPVERMGLRYGDRTTLALDGGRGAVQITPTGDPRVLDPDASGFPAVSPDGRLAAWPGKRSADGTEVVVWSVADGQEVDTFTVPERPACCDSGFRVAGVGDDGTVYVSGDHAHYVADDPYGDVRVIEGLDPYADTVVVSTNGLVALSAPTSKEGDSRARVGNVVDGRFRTDIEHEGPDVSSSSWWSPYDLGLVVSRAVGGGLRASDVDGDMYAVPERIAVPVEADVQEVAWESADALLVQVVEGDHAWWVRCSQESRGCERAADLGAGDGDTVTLPRR